MDFAKSIVFTDDSRRERMAFQRRFDAKRETERSRVRQRRIASGYLSSSVERVTRGKQKMASNGERERAR